MVDGGSAKPTGRLHGGDAAVVAGRIKFEQDGHIVVAVAVVVAAELAEVVVVVVVVVVASSVHSSSPSNTVS